MQNTIRYLVTRYVGHFDNVLLGTALALMALGLFVLYSASGQSFDRVGDQVRNMVVALVLMSVMANIAPYRLQRLSVPLYVVGMLLLIAVALVGEISHGARRWLDLGIVRVQPSEIMKLGVPLMLAWYFQRREGSLGLADFGVAAVILLAPVLLIAEQPDLGTALMVAASGAYLLFLAGISWKLLLSLAIAIGASLPLFWSLMHDYQRQRVLTLLDPAQDPLGAGYHIIQSTIALGSGGGAGKGWLNGTQTHLDFLPERTTDFIFAVFGEEFGLAGGLTLLAAYLILIGRGLYIALNSSTPFARLLAGSITLTLFTYMFINIGMVSGILPVVGVPLPLVSYGGTSMVTILVGVGVLMSINTHKQLVQS